MDKNSRYNSHGGQPDWSSLGTDVTESILNKLTIPDLIRCRDVCKSWYSISHALISSSSINSPVLVLPKHHLPIELRSDDESYFFKEYLYPTQLYCFFNPVSYELYRIKDQSRELLKMSYLVASSKGWALFIGFGDLILFSAPTGVTIRLPSPYGIERKRIILWGDPILDRKRNSYGIVGINRGILSFAVYGAVRFRYSIDLDSPQDILCFDGLVYGGSEGGFLQAWDLNRMEKNIIRGSDYVYCCNPNQPSFNRFDELRLVDSLGELWLVRKSQVNLGLWVRVYRMDFKERKWVEMDSLGGRVLFLCQKQSIAFSPLDSSKYKKDCVYIEVEGWSATDRDIYVYSLGDDSSQRAVSWRT